jgi:hypothetical protein
MVSNPSASRNMAQPAQAGQFGLFEHLSKPLLPAQLEAIFADDILPAIGVKGAASDPRLEVVYGQAGSGKSTALQSAQARFGNQPTQVVVPDDMDCYLPNFNAAAKISPQRARDCARGHSTNWTYQLFDHGLEQGANVAVEAADQDVAAYYARCANDRGVPARLCVLATDPITSYTGVLQRYDRALERGTAGNCVIMTKEAHDSWYADIPSGVHRFETWQEFGRIIVQTRDGKEAYNNVLTDREGNGNYEWHAPAGALEALIEARNKPWSEDHKKWLSRTWKELIESPRLKADDFAKTLPLDKYHADVLTAIADRGDFDPAIVKKENSRSHAVQYQLRVKEEISSALRGNYAESPDLRDSFSKRLLDYSNGVDAVVRSNLEKSAGLALAEHKATVEARRTANGRGNVAASKRARDTSIPPPSPSELAEMMRVADAVEAQYRSQGDEGARASKRQRRDSFDSLDSDDEAAMVKLAEAAEAKHRADRAAEASPSKRQRRDSFDSLDSDDEAAMVKLADTAEAAYQAELDASAPANARMNPQPDREEDPTRGPGDVVDAVGDALEEEAKQARNRAARARGLDPHSEGRGR